MTIQFYVRNVYGTDLIYLAQPKDQDLWTRLTGNKTITGRQMELMNKLTGTQFEQVLEPSTRVTVPEHN